MEFVILELSGFQGVFDLIPKSSRLANSIQFLVVWQELARIS